MTAREMNLESPGTKNRMISRLLPVAWIPPNRVDIACSSPTGADGAWIVSRGSGLGGGVLRRLAHASRGRPGYRIPSPSASHRVGYLVPRSCMKNPWSDRYLSPVANQKRYFSASFPSSRPSSPAARKRIAKRRRGAGEMHVLVPVICVPCRSTSVGTHISVSQCAVFTQHWPAADLNTL
jgi:hypothetical protein